MSALRRLAPATGFYGWLIWRNFQGAVRAPDLPLQIVATALGQVGGLIALTALLSRSTVLGGLDLATFLLIYGLVVLTEGICSVLFDGVWHLRFLVMNRELDHLLLRPRSIMLQVVFSRTGMHGIGNVLLGTGLVGYALLHVDLDPARSAAATLLVLAGLVLRAALYLLGNATAFWSTGGIGLPMAVHMMTEVGKYPLSVYAPGIRILASTVLPVAFIGFFPAMMLVGRQPWVGWSPLGVLAAAAMVAVTAAVFAAGLRSYRRN